MVARLTPNHLIPGSNHAWVINIFIGIPFRTYISVELRIISYTIVYRTGSISVYLFFSLQQSSYLSMLSVTLCIVIFKLTKFHNIFVSKYIFSYILVQIKLLSYESRARKEKLVCSQILAQKYIFQGFKNQLFMNYAIMFSIFICFL